jgi:hypothetical protein
MCCVCVLLAAAETRSTEGVRGRGDGVSRALARRRRPQGRPDRLALAVGVLEDSVCACGIRTFSCDRGTCRVTPCRVTMARAQRSEPLLSLYCVHHRTDCPKQARHGVARARLRADSGSMRAQRPKIITQLAHITVTIHHLIDPSANHNHTTARSQHQLAAALRLVALVARASVRLQHGRQRARRRLLGVHHRRRHALLPLPRLDDRLLSQLSGLLLQSRLSTSHQSERD